MGNCSLLLIYMYSSAISAKNPPPISATKLRMTFAMIEIISS